MSNRYVSHFCTDRFEKRFDAARHGEADMGPDITPRAALADKVTNADKFRCSICRSSTGEIEDGARTERAFFRRQPSHERSDFPRFPQPTQRNLRKHVVDMGLRHLREQWRSYRGWRDAIHSD